MTTRHLVLADPNGNRLDATHLVDGALVSLNGWHIVLDPRQCAELARVLLGLYAPNPGLWPMQDADEPSDGHPSTPTPGRPAESRTANPDTWPEHPTDPTDPDQDPR